MEPMINKYEVNPAVQFIVKANHISEQIEGAALDVYGAEVLCRFGSDDNAFIRPEGVSWRSIDLKMSQLIRDNIAKLPIGDTNKVFVNVSQYSLNDNESFSRWIDAIAALRESLGEAKQLVIEITEHVEDETLKKRWKTISESGVLMAIDDYGTGLSCIKRLKSFPWNYCKFDVGASTRKDIEVASEYCRKEKIKSIAEKIETLVQARAAIDSGLYIHQGYFYCKPVIHKTPKTEIKICDYAF